MNSLKELIENALIGWEKCKKGLKREEEEIKNAKNKD